jgi:hypothetical protein
VYEDVELLSSSDYKQLFTTISGMNRNLQYVDEILDSHDTVAYLMILMNSLSAEQLAFAKEGIFRISTKADNFTAPSHLDYQIKQVLTNFMSSGGYYTCFKDNESMHHHCLNVKYYVQITSPIRRMVDLVNITILQKLSGVSFNKQCEAFLQKWVARLDHINDFSKATRKVQLNAALLDLCHRNPSIISKDYTARIFGKEKNEHTGKMYSPNIFKYTLYLPELKIVGYAYSDLCIKEYEIANVKLYVFKDQCSFKQKVRFQIIPPLLDDGNKT